MQKFRKGDIVKIGECDSYMAHFTRNCYAIVNGSYETMYGGKEEEEVNEPTEYSLLLLIDNPTEVSWYPEKDLTLVSDDKKESDKIRLAYHDYKPKYRSYINLVNKMIAKKIG